MTLALKPSMWLSTRFLEQGCFEAVFVLLVNIEHLANVNFLF